MKKIFLLMLMVMSIVISANEQEVILQNENQEIVIQVQDAQNEILEEGKTIDLKIEHSIENKKETTFAIIKPDAVAAGYTGQIIDLIEKNGFEVVRMQKKVLTCDAAKTFYAIHKEKPFYNDLILYMSSGPIVILELAKENAVSDWRTLIGQTDPEMATVGTIRKMFGSSKTFNAVHGSDSKESALQEIIIMFDN